MQERSVEDRRKKQIKIEEDLREEKRREEDKANIKSYYLVLGLCIGTLFLMGTISYIWGQ